MIAHFTFLINFNDAMSHPLIVKRLELYMDLALYKINILLLLLLCFSVIHLIDNLLLFHQVVPPPLILGEFTLVEHV